MSWISERPAGDAEPRAFASRIGSLVPEPKRIVNLAGAHATIARNVPARETWAPDGTWINHAHAGGRLIALLGAHAASAIDFAGLVGNYRLSADHVLAIAEWEVEPGTAALRPDLRDDFRSGPRRVWRAGEVGEALGPR